ncbi:MAG TPA: hypothetical protein VK897_26605 [Anaerolineales bacterium]|nr:hypothetical protein [Anaerolineales bacterium]
MIKKFLSCFLLLAMATLLMPSRADAQTSTSLCKSVDWMVDQIGDEVRIFHKAGIQFPQYGVLHLNDSYFRLNYGPGSGWGTSVILMPAFWSRGVYYQGARVSVSCRFVNNLLELTIKGTFQTLTVTETIRVNHPTGTSISATVRASVNGTVPIDSKPGEAFKPVMLSSMHISSTRWDTRRACVGSQCFSIPTSGWIVPAAQTLTSTSFRLVGGTSAWKTNAPTIVISNLNTARRITGQVMDLNDPNEDNVGFWAAADKVLSSWSYKITAKRPE